MKEKIVLFFKGIAMGAANVIPGVSGGTIALITGIFERLIDAIKSFNLEAVKLLFAGKFKELAAYIDLWFLVAVFAGIGTAIISLAQLFEFLFLNYPVYIWSFFFGLVLASVYFVGKTITKWNLSVVISFVLGTAIAVAISVMTPATENDNFFYLILCGVIAICSMILPGLSGSFVLILMGNYHLVMIAAVNSMRLSVLIPVAIGAAVGLIAFSHFLSWVLKKFHNQTLAILTGFVLGSVGILWPWKEAIKQTFGVKEKIIGYHWSIPQMDKSFVIALVFIILGIATIWITEYLSKEKEKSSS